VSSLPRDEERLMLRRARAVSLTLLTLLRRAAGGLLPARVVVEGASMEPALRAGDRLLVWGLPLRWRKPRRREIVVIAGRRYGFAEGVDPIKRIVALPHESIALNDGVLRLNSQVAPEPYLDDAAREAWRVGGEPARGWHLASDEFFVLGDNRIRSRDSRAFGPVKSRHIRAVALYRYAPAGRRGRLRP
jgi:signal peptidase I